MQLEDEIDEGTPGFAAPRKRLSAAAGWSKLDEITPARATSGGKAQRGGKARAKVGFIGVEKMSADTSRLHEGETSGIQYASGHLYGGERAY
jgi:hypothetical protein